MKIPSKIIKELKSVESRGRIAVPELLFIAGKITQKVARFINTKTLKVFISRKSLKHIIDQRKDKANEVIDAIPDTIQIPDLLIDNSHKRHHSFLFIKKISPKNYGVVVEITKTPGFENQVVSAFIIDRKTYKKLSENSGGTAGHILYM